MLYTIYFKVSFQEKWKAKFLNLRFCPKTKHWYMKTKNIDESVDVLVNCCCFKVSMIISGKKICDEEFIKTYDEKFIKDNERRNKFFLEHLGLMPDEDEDEPETETEPVISENKIE